MLVCLFYFACEAAGASSARHSLRPLFSEGRCVGKARANCVAGTQKRAFTQHCRPCERRDPYAVSYVSRGAVSRLSRNNVGQGLWVPAFAGTTAKWLFDI